MKKLIALLLASMMALFCLTGCSRGSKDTVMSINGSEVSWDEFMYWLGYAANSYGQNYSSLYGSEIDYTDSENTDLIIKYAKDAAVEQHVIAAKAAEMDVTVDEDEVNDVVKNYITNYCGEDATEEDFAELLKESYATVDVFKGMIRSNLLYNALINKMYGENGAEVSDEKVQSFAKENDYITATHILLLTTDDEGNELSAKAKAKLEKQAQGFVDELRAIKDDNKRLERFNELKAEYCQDGGKESFPDGYCFTTGTMVEAFDTAARDLGKYEVSDVVASDYGYHVIMRLPLTGDDLCTVNSYPTPLRTVIAEQLFTEQFDQWVKDAKTEYVGQFKKYDFSKLFTEEGFNYMSFEEFSSAKG